MTKTSLKNLAEEAIVFLLWFFPADKGACFGTNGLLCRVNSFLCGASVIVGAFLQGGRIFTNKLLKKVLLLVKNKEYPGEIYSEN